LADAACQSPAYCALSASNTRYFYSGTTHFDTALCLGAQLVNSATPCVPEQRQAKSGMPGLTVDARLVAVGKQLGLRAEGTKAPSAYCPALPKHVAQCVSATTKKAHMQCIASQSFCNSLPARSLDAMAPLPMRHKQLCSTPIQGHPSRSSMCLLGPAVCASKAPILAVTALLYTVPHNTGILRGHAASRAYMTHNRHVSTLQPLWCDMSRQGLHSSARWTGPGGTPPPRRGGTHAAPSSA
jgi:hypothetical protein